MPEPGDRRRQEEGSGRERAGHMARRLGRELEGAGLTAAEGEEVLGAYRLAMEPRLEGMAGDDPSLLHPGRTVVVLLADVGPQPAAVLAAAALVESEDPELRIPPGRIEERVGERAAELVRAVPPSGDPRLTERLVVAEEGARLAALAERLDHLRHAHLWDDRERLRRAHAEARDVYLPVAARTHAGLEGRLRWWCEKFEDV